MDRQRIDVSDADALARAVLRYDEFQDDAVSRLRPATQLGQGRITPLIHRGAPAEPRAGAPKDLAPKTDSASTRIVWGEGNAPAHPWLRGALLGATGMALLALVGLLIVPDRLVGRWTDRVLTKTEQRLRGPQPSGFEGRPRARAANSDGAKGVARRVIEQFEAPARTWAVSAALFQEPPDGWLSPDYLSRPQDHAATLAFFRARTAFPTPRPRELLVVDPAVLAFEQDLNEADIRAVGLGPTFESGLIGLRTDWHNAVQAEERMAIEAVAFHRWLQGLTVPVLVTPQGMVDHVDPGTAQELDARLRELRDLYDRARRAREVADHAARDLPGTIVP